MTEQQLLAALAAQFNAVVSGPVTLDTKPNGDVWKQVNVRDVDTTTHVGTYKNVDYYVVDPGGPNEAAYYKDSAPTTLVSQGI